MISRGDEANIPAVGKPDILLLDGAMGTILGARGISVDGPAFSAAAVVERPDAVSQVHADYAAAGATLHTAATFRATRAALAAHAAATGRALPSATEVVRRAVSLARAAVPRDHRVLGSLASSADCYRPDEIALDARSAHREHARALADAGVDVILCETFADPDEAVIATVEARATGVPTWVALTAGPDADLLDPTEVRAAAERVISAGASAVLINCTRALSTAPLVHALRGIAVPFGAYANAGRPADRLGWVADWGGPVPSSNELQEMAINYAKIADEWVQDGAALVGGCCGTTPAHIAALARRFSSAPGK